MDKTNQISRRRFLSRSASAGAASVAAPYIVPAGVLAAPGRTGANDRIQLGFIGVGSEGSFLLKHFVQHSDVAVTGICDVWKERRDRAIAFCKGTPKPYHDYRELLQRDDVDAVVIATLPHWHTMMAIDACEAKKDFYLEKPMTLHLAESLALHRAVQKHKVITQIGTQLHAGANYRRSAEIVQSGVLGKISVARTFLVMNQGSKGIGIAPDGDPPKDLDWNRWCGPGQLRPFNPLLAKDAYHHCSFMYTGGWTPGVAPHIIDLPYWALKLGHPTRVSASGGRYVLRDSGDIPDNQEITWQYPDCTLTWMLSITNSYGFDFQGKGGIARREATYFHGVNGTLMANYTTAKVIPEGDRMKPVDTPKITKHGIRRHYRDFLDCLRSRKQPSCHVGYHYKIDVAIALSSLSYKLGRSVSFDPATEKIVGDAEAAKLAKPIYRDPWKLPEKYL